MPMFDRLCSSCGALKEDCLEPVGKDGGLPCISCAGGTMHRTLCTGKFHKAAGVTPDSIPGGYEVKHGLCWPDGTPRRYDSKSEMKRVAQDMGLENRVRHVPSSQGSDKSKHTVRWVAPPVQSEEERIKHLKQVYRDEGIDLDHLPAFKPTPFHGGADVISEIIADGFERASSSGYHDPR